MSVKTSVDLIREAEERGEAIAYLADGDVHVCDLVKHVFPDVVCKHPGCTAVFDSRKGKWLNGHRTSQIEHRDQWRFGLCPEHCTA